MAQPALQHLKRVKKRMLIALYSLAAFIAMSLLIWDGVIIGTGFSNKKVWDWLQLLIIPFILAGVALLFNARQGEMEREIATDQQQENALQAYLVVMTELLIDKGLRDSKEKDAVRSVARAQTLTLLRRLNGERKASVVKFLHEAQLISKEAMVIDLKGADLTRANLTRANLVNVNLMNTNLSGAFLIGAELQKADLTAAILKGAKLNGATLSEAQLIEADLTNADLSGVSLPGTKAKYKTRMMKTIMIGASLTKTNLAGAMMMGADLSDVVGVDANLTGANLTNATLTHIADFSRADLTHADLTEADLTGTQISDKQQAKAKSLKGATMYDGSTKHS